MRLLYPGRRLVLFSLLYLILRRVLGTGRCPRDERVRSMKRSLQRRH